MFLIESLGQVNKDAYVEKKVRTLCILVDGIAEVITDFKPLAIKYG